MLAQAFARRPGPLPTVPGGRVRSVAGGGVRARLRRERRRRVEGRPGTCCVGLSRAWKPARGRVLDRLAPRPGDGLTEAGARVAELVGQGASDRQAASALSVGVRTVETTLTRVYRKLGVASRSRLAAGWGQQPPQL